MPPKPALADHAPKITITQAFEQFAAAAAGEGGGIPDLARLAGIAAGHGIDIVGPPPVP